MAESLGFICDTYHMCIETIGGIAESLEIMNKKGGRDINSMNAAIKKNLAAVLSSYTLGISLVNLRPYEHEEAPDSLNAVMTRFNKAHEELCLEYVNMLPWGENA